MICYSDFRTTSARMTVASFLILTLMKRLPMHNEQTDDYPSLLLVLALLVIVVPCVLFTSVLMWLVDRLRNYRFPI